MDLVKGFSFISTEGVCVRLEEVPERDKVILSLARDGETTTATLDKTMFEAFMDLKYSLTVNRFPAKQEEEED